jgi:hypothetical protein
MNVHSSPRIPPDFTDEASYRAYLKAEAAGLVRINGKTPNRQQAQAQLAALNGGSRIPPDFTDEASYRAYLKAEAAGLVRIFSRNPGHVAQPAPSALSAAPTSTVNSECHLSDNGEFVNCTGFVGLAVLSAKPAH